MTTDTTIDTEVSTERGFFQAKQTKPKPMNKPKPPASDDAVRNVMQIKSADILLTLKQRPALLRQIRLGAGVPKKHYEALYQLVINRFTELGQALPHGQQKAYQGAGGLVDYGLWRTALVMEERRKELKLMGVMPNMESRQQARKTYALFTLALLRDIGEVVANYRILVTDAKGKVLGRWMPMIASIADMGGGFYRAFHNKYDDAGYRSHSTLALAIARMVPEVGINWIAEDPDLFSQWLRALLGEGEGILEIEHYFDRVNALLENGEPHETIEQVLKEIAEQTNELERDVDKQETTELADKQKQEGKQESKQERTHVQVVASDLINWVSENRDVVAVAAAVTVIDSGAIMVTDNAIKQFAKEKGLPVSEVQQALSEVSYNQVDTSQNQRRSFFGGASEQTTSVSAIVAAKAEFLLTAVAIGDAAAFAELGSPPSQEPYPDISSGVQAGLSAAAKSFTSGFLGRPNR